MPLKIAILASGNGSNAQAIIDAIRDGRLDCSVELIFSNNPDAFVLQRARQADLPAEVLDHRSFANRVSFDLALMNILTRCGCQIIALAGYMRLLSSPLLKAYEGRILNIHPALLPSFPGTHGIEDALAYGVKLTGVSIHFVEEKMDSGPLIIQAALPVKQDENPDELEKRIHAIEHRIYPQALQWLAEERIAVEGRKVLLRPGLRAPAAPDRDYLVWPPLEEGF